MGFNHQNSADDDLDSDSGARLFSAVVADTLDLMGLRHQVVNHRITHRSGPSKLFGRVKTAKVSSVLEPPSEPYKLLLDGIDSARRGDVLIMAAGGQVESGLFGGLLANACRASGVQGAIVDGGIRDVAELASLDFPTYAVGLCPADSYGRQEVTEVDVPVVLGGVDVTTGDLLVADVDGVVVVPAGLAPEVLHRALDKISTEAKMRTALRGGMPLREAFETFGVL
jgi:4-hydroxy-4-methyl-2-oxoglutarate aldolase